MAKIRTKILCTTFLHRSNIGQCYSHVCKMLTGTANFKRIDNGNVSCYITVLYTEGKRIFLHSLHLLYGARLYTGNYLPVKINYKIFEKYPSFPSKNKSLILNLFSNLSHYLYCQCYLTFNLQSAF